MTPMVSTTSGLSAKGEGLFASASGPVFNSSNFDVWYNYGTANYAILGSYGTVLDTNGNIYSLHHVLAGVEMIMLVKFDNSGNKLWSRRLQTESGGSFVPKYLSIDNYNNLYITCTDSSANVIIKCNSNGDYLNYYYFPTWHLWQPITFDSLNNAFAAVGMGTTSFITGNSAAVAQLIFNNNNTCSVNLSTTLTNPYTGFNALGAPGYCLAVGTTLYVLSLIETGRTGNARAGYRVVSNGAISTLQTNNNLNPTSNFSTSFQFTKLVVDSSGNVIVASASSIASLNSSLSSFNWAYNATIGSINPPILLAVDSNNNVIHNLGDNTKNVFCSMSSSGSLNFYNAFFDAPYYDTPVWGGALTTDKIGNFYFSGSTYGNSGSVFPNSNYPAATWKLNASSAVQSSGGSQHSIAAIVSGGQAAAHYQNDATSDPPTISSAGFVSASPTISSVSVSWNQNSYSFSTTGAPSVTMTNGWSSGWSSATDTGITFHKESR